MSKRSVGVKQLCFEGSGKEGSGDVEAILDNQIPTSIMWVGVGEGKEGRHRSRVGFQYPETDHCMHHGTTHSHILHT